MNDARTIVDELFRGRREVFLRVLTRRLGSPEQAEETLQEAFIQFERAARTQTISNADAFLMQTALNLAVDRIRQDASRRKRERRWADATYAGTPGADYVDGAPAPDRALMAKDELARVAHCLQDLSPTVRTAFILHKVRGMSHSETAGEMGLSKSTIEKHIMKAMKHLMEKMADGDA